MDRVSSLIYPGGRTLAGWWRQLAPRQPLALAVGYAFLHRVEAPVSVLVEQPIEPLAHLFLQAFALEKADGVRVADLQNRLRLPAPMVQRVLAGMNHDGLLAHADADRWHATERGRVALEQRAFQARVSKRHVFPFLERLDPAGQRLAAPQFVPISECVGVSWPVDEAHRIDGGAVKHCLEQSPSWKEAHGLPGDVEMPPAEPALEAWQHVLVDRPERVMLALILVKGEAGQEVQGYCVKTDGWTLLDREPVLSLPAPAEAVAPELTQTPPLHVWQDAWRGWCKQRQLPANEVDLCVLTYQPPRLEVQAPPRLVQRLQAAKSDLFKGEAWILVGDGYVRTAVQLAVRA